MRIILKKMKVTPEDIKRWQAKGLKVIGAETKQVQLPKKPKMNKTETLYANMLEAMKRSGEIVHYGFEEITLKLGNDTRYTPDFFVVYSMKTPITIEFQFHETKGGYIRDDGRVKFQCARKQFPFFKFKMMQLKKGTWSEIYPD